MQSVRGVNELVRHFFTSFLSLRPISTLASRGSWLNLHLMAVGLAVRHRLRGWRHSVVVKSLIHSAQIFLVHRCLQVFGALTLLEVVLLFASLLLGRLGSSAGVHLA